MKTRTYAPTPLNLHRLARALQRGELVGIPTETVYGLAANALDPEACRSIFRAKGRPTQDPLIVHVLNLAEAERLAEFNETARRVARRFWPGPLTLILPKQQCVPGIVTANRATVALRSPAHPLTRRLMRLAGLPLAAPSANPFGYVSPTSAAHVVDGLGGKIPHVLDGGSARVGVESTILDLSEPKRPRILRPGAVTAATLEKFLQVKILRPRLGRRRGKPTSGLVAPGLLLHHYSPRTRLVLAPAWSELPAAVGGIYLRRPAAAQRHQNVYWLSERGSLAEVARNLYDVLRRADHGGHQEIWIEALPGEAEGLADAILDRLRRASAKR